MHDRVKGAMRYPIIVMITIALAVVFLSTFVIPKFAPVFAQLKGDLPLPTQILLGSSTLVRDYWYACRSAFIAFARVRRAALPRDDQDGRYRWDRFKLRVPVIGKLMYESTLVAHQPLDVDFAGGRHADDADAGGHRALVGQRVHVREDPAPREQRGARRVAAPRGVRAAGCSRRWCCR